MTALGTVPRARVRSARLGRWIASGWSGSGSALVLGGLPFGSGALFAKPVYGAGRRLADPALLAVPHRGKPGLGLAPGGPAGGGPACATCPRRRVAIALGLGVLYLGNAGTYYAGLETVSASVASADRLHLSGDRGGAVVARRAPVSSVADRGSPWRWPCSGTALALGGIPAGAVPPLSGLIQVILSPIIYAVWIVLSARLSGETTERVGGEADDGADTAAATALMMVATAVGFWSLAVATGGRSCRRPSRPRPGPGSSASAWSRPSSRSRRSTPGRS